MTPENVDIQTTDSSVLNKNQIVSMTITDFGDDGEGIGRACGIPVFVRGAMIGDTLSARITKVKKHLAYARVEEITSPSADRVESPCAHDALCGGCCLQAYDYAAALRYKKKKIRDALVRIGHFEEALIDALIADCEGMEDPLRYRNKAQYPAGLDENGRIVFGFFAPHSHRIVPVTDCVVSPKEHKKILDAVRESMEIAGVFPYNEEDGTGYVRHVLIRRTADNSRYLVCLVVNATEALSPLRDVLIIQLTQINAVTSVSFNYNPHRTNVILGEHTERIYGQDFLEDRLCDLSFRISAPAFYQVNPQITERLYRRILSLSALTGAETVWDLYCGIGTIALTLAANGAKEVYGVEVSDESVRLAKENAKLNGIAHAHFFAADASRVCAGEEASLESAEDGAPARVTLPAPDLIVVDPPRKGLSAELADTLLGASPKRILYVSCNPSTLARDLRILSDGGYKPAGIFPYDMFPFSVHVEVVVSMSRAGSGL